MELTLKRLLEHAEFKKYRGKGYDPAEVDDFLDRATAMAGKVEAQLTQALERAKLKPSEAGGPSPAEIEAEVERRVAVHLAGLPQADAGQSEEEAAEEVRLMLVMAQRTADGAVAEAKEKAEAMLADATQRSEAMVADATQRSEAMVADATETSEAAVAEAEARATALNREVDERTERARADVEAEISRERREARQRLADEIGELEAIRESLRTDVNVLERHVEDQRSQLGSTLAELQQILDDPSGFRMAPAPELIDPVIPENIAQNDEPDPTPGDTAGEGAPGGETEGEASADGSPDQPAEGSAEGSEQAAAPLAIDEVDHAAPGIDDPDDSGPPTAPVAAVGEPGPHHDDDDAFLTELRKAMVDDEPLGPRDQTEPSVPDALFEDGDRRGWRFGRRR